MKKLLLLLVCLSFIGCSRYAFIDDKKIIKDTHIIIIYNNGAKQYCLVSKEQYDTYQIDDKITYNGTHCRQGLDEFIKDYVK